jgi:hypothetical protein
VTWVGVPENQFRILEGEDRLRWYTSSKQGRRGFCTHCGSTLFFQSSVCPGEVHIALPYVEGRIDREPELHVFFDSHVDWFAFPDDLPKLGSDSELLANYRDVEPAGVESPSRKTGKP